MLVDVGGEYKNLVDTDEYLSVIDEKISSEFAREIELMIWESEREKERLREQENSDFKYIEMENEDLRRLIDDVNSEIQCYLCPIEEGKRINRQDMIRFLNRIIKLLSQR